MSTTTCHMSISLDGYVAGPDQSLEHPLGRRGFELHRWHIDEPLNEADARARAAGVVDELVLDFVPVLLGDGEALFDGVPNVGLEPVEVIHSPLATHVRYRVAR